MPKRSGGWLAGMRTLLQKTGSASDRADAALRQMHTAH